MFKLFAELERLGAMRFLRAKVGLCTAAGQIWSSL